MGKVNNWELQFWRLGFLLLAFMMMVMVQMLIQKSNAYEQGWIDATDYGMDLGFIGSCKLTPDYFGTNYCDCISKVGFRSERYQICKAFRQKPDGWNYS